MKSKISELEMVKMYKNGASFLDLQKKSGLWNYFTTIRPILVRHGVRIRERGEHYNRPIKSCKINVEYFKNIDSSEKAYWLGFIYADGCVTKDKVAVVLKRDDIESIINLKKAIESSHKISKYENFDKRTGKIYKNASIQISSHQFAKTLIERGVFHKASKNYDFPKDLSDRFVLHFIRGLFDGDGSIGLKKDGAKRISLIASLNIINFIQDFLFKNFNIDKLTIQSVTKNNKDICKMLLYKDAVKFLDLIYKDSTEMTRMRRKYELYLR